MSFRAPCLGLMVLCLPAATLSQAQELAVDCAGYPRWAATTNYLVGAKVTYNGGLYRATAASNNVPPNVCPTGGWWQLLGTCSSTGGCTTLPTAPAGLRSPAQTSSSITLMWNAASAPSNCSVTYNVFNGTTRIAAGLAVPSMVITGLAASTTYYLGVSATDAAGTSAQSPSFAVRTLAGGGAGCATVPDVPTGFGSPSQTSTSISLAWNPVTTPAGCPVTYNLTENGLPLVTVPTTTAIVSGLAPGTSYSFTVAAADAAGSSQPSGVLSVQTRTSTIPTPASVLAGIKARMTSGNQVNSSPHLNTMRHSQSVNVYQVVPGVFAFSSGMAIDTDGSDPDPDPDHQGQTTWQTSDGRYLGAHHVPYYVLGDVCYDGRSPCKWFFYEDRDVSALQFALVFYNGKVIGAVFGDTQGPPGGDARELGEASVRTAELLGIDGSGTSGGVDSGVTYVVFSGSQWVLTGTNGTLGDNAQALVAKALDTLASGLLDGPGQPEGKTITGT